MRQLLLSLLVFLFFFNVNGQVRNGWRSIYDKEGRLTRMYYYDNGICVVDSNLFFQYHSENLLKALVTGEINTQQSELNGSVSIFDYMGFLTSYNIKRNGQLTFELNCDYEQNCNGVWSDLFESESGDWGGENFSIENSELVIQNKGSIAYAVYKPGVPIDIKNDFACKLLIPVQDNSAKQGLALCWKNVNNYFMFELSYGKYYSVNYMKDGVFYPVTDGRQLFERPDDVCNELVVRRKSGSLIVEVNGVIEFVYDCPNFTGNTIALVTRSSGNARFSDFIFKNTKIADDEFIKSKWIGKGTGFFISPSKILTTYDVVAESKKLRIKGNVDGKSYVFPAVIYRIDEENNLAVLEIDEPNFVPFETLPFGYSDKAPMTESMSFSLGYPNAISGIYMEPEVFKGQILNGSASYSNCRMVEMSFRYGLIGSPVFDNDVNLIGICAYKGMDIKYTEMIDFYQNNRLFKANIGRFDLKVESPIKNKTTQDKIKALRNIVVIVESSVLNFNE